MAELMVRPLERSDVENIVRYFHDASPSDLARMGVDAEHLPSQDEMRASLIEVAAKPAGQSSSCYLIWEIDGRAVGFSSLKDIEPSRIGGMHLHMWDALSRGKGMGAELFCRSALAFYRLYGLPILVCEPRAANPMPNNMLRKVGFPLVRTYVGRSSALSAETELNRYEITQSIAERYTRMICLVEASSPTRQIVLNFVPSPALP